jgi:AmiR/NasT family two-component response regulator
VFDERAERLGELFAAPAAIAVQNAQILAQARRLAEGLQAALANHAVIDQAVGIQMARSGITAEQALHRLRVTSRREHRKMAAVAADVVQAAVRRARAKGRRPAP